MTSFLDYLPTPYGYPSSEILMHHYHCCKRCTTYTFFVVGHGGCCKILGIQNKSLLSDPFWKITVRILGWVPTRAISLWNAVFIDMALFDTLVTSHIWPAISTMEALEVNLRQSLVDRLINGHSSCFRKWGLVLRLFFTGSRFPLLWIDKITVFARSLL